METQFKLPAQSILTELALAPTSDQGIKIAVSAGPVIIWDDPSASLLISPEGHETSPHESDDAADLEQDLPPPKSPAAEHHSKLDVEQKSKSKLSKSNVLPGKQLTESTVAGNSHQQRSN